MSGGGSVAEHLEKSISGGGLGRRGYEGNVFPEVSVWKISNFLRKTIVSSKQKEADPQPILIFWKIGTENWCFWRFRPRENSDFPGKIGFATRPTPDFFKGLMKTYTPIHYFTSFH